MNLKSSFKNKKKYEGFRRLTMIVFNVLTVNQDVHAKSSNILPITSFKLKCLGPHKSIRELVK